MNTVVVDDHELMRDLLRDCCASIPNLKLVGEAGTGKDAVQLILQTRPDLLLLDLCLPDTSGFHILRSIREANFSPRYILLISGYCNDLTVFLAERADVQGFLFKTATSMANICQAINDVVSGRNHWSGEFIAVREARHGDPNAFDKILSPREIEILILCGALYSDQEISNRLGISPDTAVKHRANILRKLDVQSRLELIRYAQRHGFHDVRMMA
jgi:DNA-binding NarL/FixJ family response regulator